MNDNPEVNFECLKGAVVLGAALILPAASWGAAVSIVSFDITNASVAGCGSWSHSYRGTITANGGNGQIGCSLAPYSGGIGTLNDSVIGSYSRSHHRSNAWLRRKFSGA